MHEMLLTADFNELNGLHSTFVEYLRQYYFTGGMPEAVQEYIDSGSLENVRAIQKQILSDYSNDISKHAPKKELVRIDQVWQSCLDNDNPNAVRLSMLPYKKQEWMVNIPFYATERL